MVRGSFLKSARSLSRPRPSAPRGRASSPRAGSTPRRRPRSHPCSRHDPAAVNRSSTRPPPTEGRAAGVFSGHVPAGYTRRSTRRRRPGRLSVDVSAVRRRRTRSEASEAIDERSRLRSRTPGSTQAARASRRRGPSGLRTLRAPHHSTRWNPGIWTIATIGVATSARRIAVATGRRRSRAQGRGNGERAPTRVLRARAVCWQRRTARTLPRHTQRRPV